MRQDCAGATDDERFMRLALEEARQAAREGEVPVGAVITVNGRVLAKGHNQTEALTDVTAHAEMIALTSAQNNLGGRALPECTLYVTVEPCLMCAGAIGWARVGRIVWGADDPKKGFRSHYGVEPFHPKAMVRSGVLAEECGETVRDFFRKRR